MKKSPVEIPKELFGLMAALYPLLARLLIELELTMNDFFFLAYIRYFGKEHVDGGIAILRSELGNVFDPLLNPSGVTQRIDALEEKNLVRRGRVKGTDKAKMYGSKGGSKVVVFISKDGMDKLEIFNSRINEVFVGVTGNVQRTFLRSFLGIVRRMAKGGLGLIEARKEVERKQSDG